MTTTMILAALLAGGDAPAVTGDYAEARTCDVWTGPCFANGEMHLVGKNAVAAWSVTRGSYGGETLDGLKIVAAFDAEGTLHTSTEGKVGAVLIVDDRATEAQAKALVSLARDLAPRHLKNVVSIERARIAFERKGLAATVTAGEIATIKTGCFCEADQVCCNEEQFYPAISGGTRVECAKTLAHSYQGRALPVRWSEPAKRSAMVGSFSR